MAEPDSRRLPPRLRLRDLSIGGKLAAIVIAFVLAIAGLLVVMTICLAIGDGARAYVGGEGLWSKGQKDAVYYLLRYARTRDEEDFERHRRAIAIPLGDRRARLEMEKPHYDYAVVEAGFIAGGIAPEDVPELLFLFRWFGGMEPFKSAIAIWREADGHIDELSQVAEALHAAVPAQARHSELLDRIEQLNAALTPLEARFSATLGDAARGIGQLLPVAIVSATALLLALGLAVAARVSRALRAEIRGLREGAIQVAGGELSHRIEVRSRDEFGDLAQVFNNMVAQREASEAALRSATEFRDKVMEAASNSIHVIDLEGRFTLVNRRTSEITGYSQAELLGMSYMELIPPEYRAAVTRQFERAAREGRTVWSFETPLQRKDGTSLIITFTSSPLMKDGRIAGVVGTAEDVTERKRAAHEAAAHAEELARSNRELEQFAYAASHDLQEPLRTVSIYTQLLAQRYAKQDDEAVHELMAYVTDAVQRMRELIEGLLAYSRVSRAEHGFEQADLDRLLEDALANLAAAIQGSGATIVRAPMPTLRVNPPLITLLLQNLIGNALKFVRSDEVPRVQLGARREGSEWLFSVQDNGIGIDPRHADRVFTMFQRLHTRDLYPGNGIGLAICRRIVERHGGRIWVEPGFPGSVFHFTLPVEEPTDRVAVRQQT